MARPDKAAAIAALKEKFSSSNAAVLTEYRGLTVQNLKELRRSLGEDASYAVAKNTLTRIAAKEAGVEGLDEQLTGPTAVAFINGDVATVAKGLRDFAKDNPLLVIKGGVLDGKVLDAETVKKLADLESREVLLAKLAGAFKASLSNAAALFSAPLSQAARLLGALETKANEDPSVIGGAGNPAAGDQELKTAEQSAPEAADAAEATEDAADSASTDAASHEDASNN
ncbi:large subunit ribosomal protein L10 [Propionibacterium cyclohexanicum]|uniref:Large ribosomal subunit protein uL10 n=1 Tax=Propionibacterium cyclohexanicum TaxID=64702 RepID=A0A1H9S1T5_9ACTN|nr:50S ribosomal protein L10 [Propionibacterium cyclohexanicum]SER78904.1 large subunit ribosomal protein L10 [Propionibacterium cyclohexanicum]